MQDDIVYAFAIGSVMSIILTGGLSTVWGLVNESQIIAHMPLLNVMIPANASIAFAWLINIANFDYPWVGNITEFVQDKMKLIGESDPENTEKTSKRERRLQDNNQRTETFEISSFMEESGYETFTPYVTLAFQIILLSFVFSALLLLKILN